MPDTTWKLKAIFGEALDLTSDEEREAYLKRVCGDDAVLRQEVDSLLAAHREADGFLNRVVPKLESPLPFPPIAERPGTQVGRYKLLEEIGEGGMGVVYEAEQQEPVHRKVALKIVKPGVDTREVIRRFEFERQALALMDHPNIAHMFDGGATESGRPYFVMELVEGIPITDYCDRGELTVAQRLELFVLVCQAVQHAHQKGIIHRDLKPTNMLVAVQDAKPVPKIVDFGVAKAMGPGHSGEATATHAGQMVGTPLYMSLEQAEGNGQKVDTRSDVYSLGVVLYELLTGTTPFEKERFREANFEQVCMAIRTEDPPTPSSRISTLEAAKATTIAAHRKTDRVRLRHLLRSDLDWIVMKALERDPERRYATARDLGEDVGRFLNGEPIDARPPSLLDRVGKWSRRHRTVVASAGCIAAILLVAVTLVAVARRKADLAFAQRQQLVQQRINDALGELARFRGQAANGDAQGHTALTRAREYVQGAADLAESGPTDPELLARVRRLAADLDQEGKQRKLLAALDQAWLAQATTQDTSTVPGLACPCFAPQCNFRFADEESLPILRKCLEAYGLVVGQGPPEQAAAFLRAQSEQVRQELLAALDEWRTLVHPPVGIALQHAFDGGRFLYVPDSESPAGRDGRLKLGDHLVGVGQGADGPFVDVHNMICAEIDALLRRQTSDFVRIQVIPRDSPRPVVGEGPGARATPEPRVYKIPRDRSVDWIKAVIEASDSDPWRTRVREAFDVPNGGLKRVALEKLAKEAEIDRQPVRILNQLGNHLSSVEGLVPAAAFLRRVRQRHPADVGVNINLADIARLDRPRRIDEEVRYYSAVVLLRPDSAGARTHLGLALREQGKLDEALDELREAVRLSPNHVPIHGALGSLLAEKNEFAKAADEFREAIRLQPGNPLFRCHLGDVLLKQAQPAEAADEFREAIRRRPDHAPAHRGLGAAFEEMGKIDEAIAEYREAVRIDPKSVDIRCGLGKALALQKKSEEAIFQFQEAIRRQPNYAPAHHALGCAFEEMGKLDEAIAAYRKAIGIDPKSAGIRCDLGKALVLQKKFQDAIDQFREAIRIDSKYFGVHNNLAKALVCQGKLHEAIAEYRTEIRLHPDCAEAHGGLICALFELGKPDEAIAVCRQTLPPGVRAWAQGVLTDTETRGFPREDRPLRSWRFPGSVDSISSLLFPLERWCVTKSRFCTAVLVLGVLTAAESAPAQTKKVTYAVTDLGTLGGMSWANGVNNFGDVVGASGSPQGDRAFFWDGTMHDLGTLSPGATGSKAHGINDKGQIVGWSKDNGNTSHAFLYDNGTMQELPTLIPGPSPISEAHAINNSGQVVGASSINDSTYHACLWVFDGVVWTITDLAVPASAPFDPNLRSNAWGINNLGQIVGNARINSATYHAFLYENGQMVDLGALGADSNSSWADGINDFGQIVGFSYIDGTTRHPCLWEKVGGDWRITDLGALAGSNSYAVSFNDFGQVVGHGTSAWLYDGVMHDLNDLIPVGSGWYLRNAMAINDQGQIVGFGPNPTGAIHGFLLNPTYSYTSAGSAVAIKDNAPTSQAMTLTDAYLISDLNVTVNLTHARYADLKIELKGPEDSACQLLCNAGGLQGSGTKTIVFDDDGAAGTIPCQLLRGYEGKNIRGTWTLRVTDTVKNNKTGTLNSWALTEVPGTP